MNTLIEKEVEARSLRFWEGQADYVDAMFLMPTPYPVLVITVSYLFFVLRLGPEWMKSRPPYVLRKLLFAYNLAQVFFSIFLGVSGVKLILKYGLFQRTCIMNNEDIKHELLTESHWYLIAKVTELLDTIFFVLRKKQKQVTFLHVYHHTMTFVTSWSLIKYARVDDLIFAGTLNSFVHVFMYGYYALSVFPWIAKHLWWKKHITTMQMVQFMMVLVYFPIKMAITECPASYIISFLVFSNGFFFLYLFSDFYRKTYLKNTVKNENVTVVNSSDDEDLVSKFVNKHR